MLDYEFELIGQRLKEQRGGATWFLVFAEAVPTRSFLQLNESHGWMGVPARLEIFEPKYYADLEGGILDGWNETRRPAAGSAVSDFPESFHSNLPRSV